MATTALLKRAVQAVAVVVVYVPIALIVLFFGAPAAAVYLIAGFAWFLLTESAKGILAVDRFARERIAAYDAKRARRLSHEAEYRVG